jgi:outer membrane protein assembly factor BamB
VSPRGADHGADATANRFARRERLSANSHAESEAAWRRICAGGGRRASQGELVGGCVSRDDRRIRFRVRHLFLAGTLTLAFHPAAPASASTSCPSANWAIGGGGYAHTRYDCKAGSLNAASYTKRWSYNTHGFLEFPPAYAKGVLYTGQLDGWLTAITVDGELIWKRRLRRSPVGSRYVSVIVQTPTYRNGRLYLDTGNLGGLYAINATTGKTIWKRRIGRAEDSPIVIGSGRRARVFVDDRQGCVYSFTARLGRLRWRHCGWGLTNATMAYAKGKIVGADYNGHVWAYSRSGRMLWRHYYGFSSVYANIAYDRSRGQLVIASRLGRVYSLHAKRGRLMWRTRNLGGTVYGHPAIAQGHIYTTSTNGYFWRINERTGRVTWSRHMRHRAAGGPVVLGRRVYFTEKGPRNQHGIVHGYSVRRMRQVFRFNDGRSSPLIPVPGQLIMVGFTTLYGLAPN